MDKKKLKIAFLSFYSGTVYRGVETYVHELSNKLIELGHKVTVYQSGPKLAGSKYITVSVGPAFYRSKTGYLGLYLNTSASILESRKFTKKVLAQMDPSTDIVVATNNRFQVLLTRLWTKKHGVKLVVPGQGGPGLDERIALWCFPDAFVPISGYQRKWAKRANLFVNVSQVIHNGVDLSKFFKKSPSLKLNLPKPIILCVAAFWPMKRLPLLIKAVSKLKKGSLLIVGKGELEGELKSLGKKLLGERFETKAFPHHKMPAVYAAADLFSYPTSSWESFGIVLIEAMASGLGVVAADDPIRKEIVGEAGLFVDPTDSDAYALALERALKINWGSKPRKQAEEFSWDKIARKYEDLFFKLIE